MRQKARPMRAHIKLASVNIRGFATAQAQTQYDKWLRINQMVREQRIAVLAIQEAHLTNERADTLKQLFEEQLLFEFSADPINGGAARGVAFIINRRIVKDPHYTAREVVPGRAMLLELQWSGDRKLRILNVYGPNTTNENASFWTTIKEKRLGRIDVLLGDLNFVEDPIDRLPAHEDRIECVEAFRELKEVSRLVDGWRMTHLNEKAFTYVHTNGSSHSRIDRIYLARPLYYLATNWGITEPGLSTDHRMVYVELADLKAPYVGKGRWAAPTHLLVDEKMRMTMRKLANDLAADLEALQNRTQERNPQTVYLAFKKKLATALRDRAKAKIPKLQRRLEALRNDRDKILALTDETTSENEKQKLHTQAALLQDRIAKMEQKRFERTRGQVAAKYIIANETLSKTWIRAHYTP
ncbi:DNase I-like protein, partial [Cubamyces sp. BRFM 1775]